MASESGEDYTVHWDPDAPRVLIGTDGGTLPAAFTIAVDRQDGAPFKLDLSYAGDRVNLDQLLVTRGGESVTITPAQVARLQPGHWVRKAALDSWFKPSEFYVEAGPRNRLVLVAGVWSFEYAAWGDPRRAVMEHLGVSRTTAARWIREAFDNETRFPPSALFAEWLAEPPSSVEAAEAAGSFVLKARGKAKK